MAKDPKNRKSKDSDPYSVALRLLTYRDRSTAELAGKLRDRGFDNDDIDAVIDRCLDLKFLDDERFAMHRARALVGSGRAVGIRACNDLTRAGIDRDRSEQAVAEAEAEIDMPSLLEEILQRRYPGFEFAQATEKDKNRVVGFFQRRGFPVSMILDVLKKNEI